MIELKIRIANKAVCITDEKDKFLFNYENTYEQLESEHTKLDLINIIKSFLLSCPYSNGED
jgi:hypothetical protein